MRTHPSKPNAILEGNEAGILHEEMVDRNDCRSVDHGDKGFC